jgi:hydroxymethylglutaryl-CoA lyase
VLEVSASVRITEVGPRDGLQNESAVVPAKTKVEFIERLLACGFPEIEVTSFVSAKWVPQLGDGAEVIASLTRLPGTLLSALVPNERGLDAALAARIDKVAVFVSATEGFSQRNTNGSISEVLLRIAPVIARARAAKLPVRGYISCVVRCPCDGPTSPASVREVCARLLELGVTEIDLGDTIGAAEPDDIARLFEGLADLVSPSDATLHLHDTRGRASACVERGLSLGVRSFDASVAGLGGCPYATGAPGNLATESLLATLDRAGFTTEVNSGAVGSVAQWIRQQLASLRGASS